MPLGLDYDKLATGLPAVKAARAVLGSSAHAEFRRLYDNLIELMEAAVAQGRIDASTIEALRAENRRLREKRQLAVIKESSL